MEDRTGVDHLSLALLIVSILLFLVGKFKLLNKLKIIHYYSIFTQQNAKEEQQEAPKG